MYIRFWGLHKKSGILCECQGQSCVNQHQDLVSWVGALYIYATDDKYKPFVKYQKQWRASVNWQQGWIDL